MLPSPNRSINPRVAALLLSLAPILAQAHGAFATAQAGGGVSFGVALNAVSAEQASAMALERCEAAALQFKGLGGALCRSQAFETRGFVAIAHSQGFAQLALEADPERARQNALTLCAQSSPANDPCRIFWEGVETVGKAPVKPPAAQASLPPRALPPLPAASEAALPEGQRP